MALKIGPYTLTSHIVLAPMAGITDHPYRAICRDYGAGLTVSEMITSDASLFHTRKTQLRLIQKNEPTPRSVQIVGTDPEVMANAAQFNVENGANIIDINMGCPAKKVCNTFAGSALMRDPKLVKTILQAIIKQVSVPVTLKIRTGWGMQHKNALEIARIAEDCGISSLAIHGRTRTQGYTGFAEYETIRQIKLRTNLPIIANGDICNAQDAQFILDYTGADGLMLGRVTQGQPWIIKEIIDQLHNGKESDALGYDDKVTVMLNHIDAIHRYYGTDQGVRIARKHIGWYLYNLIGQKQNLLKSLKKEIFSLNDATEQYHKLAERLVNPDFDHGTVESQLKLQEAC